MVVGVVSVGRVDGSGHWVEVAAVVGVVGAEVGVEVVSATMSRRAMAGTKSRARVRPARHSKIRPSVELVVEVVVVAFVVAAMLMVDVILAAVVLLLKLALALVLVLLLLVVVVVVVVVVVIAA